jgi:glucosamine-6-phosphate deaminase
MGMQVLIKRDYEELSRQAARLVAEAIRVKPKLVLCLAAGNTPQGMYRELIRIHRETRLDFSRVSFFQLDEYAGLRSDHPQSFRVILWRTFLNYINVRRANVYLPDESYDQTIQKLGGIDLLISGIGVNGHLAFNEPGSNFDSRTRLVDLADSTLQLMKGNFPPDEVPHQAITMGLGTIFDARRILLIASGTSKAVMLARALTEGVTPEVPASLLQRHPNVTVIADEEAAAIYRSISHVQTDSAH